MYLNHFHDFPRSAQLRELWCVCAPPKVRASRRRCNPAWPRCVCGCGLPPLLCATHVGGRPRGRPTGGPAPRFPVRPQKTTTSENYQRFRVDHDLRVELIELWPKPGHIRPNSHVFRSKRAKVAAISDQIPRCPNSSQLWPASNNIRSKSPNVGQSRQTN